MLSTANLIQCLFWVFLISCYCWIHTQTNTQMQPQRDGNMCGGVWGVCVCVWVCVCGCVCVCVCVWCVVFLFLCVLLFVFVCLFVVVLFCIVVGHSHTLFVAVHLRCDGAIK